MFKLTMLKAGKGDALWLSFGDANRPRNILCDAGEEIASDAILQQIESLRLADSEWVEIEILIVTHTDADHINGAIWLVTNAAQFRVKIKAIWFNGFLQLFQPESALGFVKAEEFSAMIKRRQIPHNANFPGKIVARSARDFPSETIEGLRLTVLGPNLQRLDALKSSWSSLRKEKLGARFYGEIAASSDPGDDLLGGLREYDTDSSAPNGSSIVLLIEFEHRSVLLAADAFADDIEQSLKDLKRQRHVEPITVFKLPHHGSIRNLSESLLTYVGAQHYLISTSGQNDKHPSIETFKLILENNDSAGKKPQFYFNYEKPRDKIRALLSPETCDLHGPLIQW